MKYIPEVDGLRAVSCLLILALHTDIRYCRLYYLGVPMFFVLSGFLITPMLLNGLSSLRYFETFYLRRALRIFPAYYASLLFGLLVFAVLIRPVAATDIPWVTACLFYYSNYYQQITIMPLAHTWSLSVEEQFYLAYPLLIFLIRRSRYLFLWLAVLAGISLLWRYVNLYALHDYAANYLSLQTNMFSLLMGAMAYLVSVRIGFLARFHQLNKCVVVGTGLVLLVVFAVQPFSPWKTERGDLVWSLLDGCAVLFTCTTLLHIRSADDSWYKRALRTPQLLYVGRLSYSLYLTHRYAFLAVLWVYRQFYPPVSSMYVRIPLALVMLGLAFLIADAMHRYIELPLLKWKDRIPVAQPATRLA